MEDDMETAARAIEMVFLHILGGLGLFFTGVGVLWFVSVYKEKNS
jgi:hypothetical protein